MLFAATLFLFWIVLSGKFDWFHLGLGVFSTAIVVFATRPLRGHKKGGMGDALAWPGYLLWLTWQIVISAVQVAKIVLQPRMPIDPKLVRFKRPLPNAFAHMTLANSITLTPGTVTVGLEGDEYEIHALTEDGADSLAPKTGEGEMPLKVAALFKVRT